MPIVASRYAPPFFLRSGHVQTVLGAVLPRRVNVAFVRERLELADGDFVDLDWLRAGHARLAILTHGLEGSSAATYIRGLAQTLTTAGWDALAWNFRGCSGEPNRLLRYYHAGDTGDLRAVIAHVAARYRNLALAGFSLGGNVTLKYLGEAPPHPAVRAAVAIDAAVDLQACVHRLDREAANWLYRRRFLRTLLARIEVKARQFPGQLDLTGLHAIRGIEEYDDRYAAPIHGFRGAADYYARSSARPFLPSIAVPTLLLNALDDPFLAPSCFPRAEAEASAHLHLETPAHGGHVGFLDFQNGTQPWCERRVVEFFREVAG
jgi:predicted alpha/beta-fold hydrolase